MSAERKTLVGGFWGVFVVMDPKLYVLVQIEGLGEQEVGFGSTHLCLGFGILYMGSPAQCKKATKE